MQRDIVFVVLWCLGSVCFGGEPERSDYSRLRSAVLSQETGKVAVIIGEGVNIDAREPGRAGRTALFDATVSCGTGMVAYLIAQGANVNAIDNYGRCCLHLAVSDRRGDVAQILLKCGADVDAYDKRGWAPLHLAAFNGDVELAGLLIHYNADVDACLNEGRYTPLHCAASRRQREMMEYLMGRGAEPSKKDAKGRTASDIAVGGSGMASSIASPQATNEMSR
jgi:ankyrin repeat protein